MITKAKKTLVDFTSSDGATFHTIEDVKVHELFNLAGHAKDSTTEPVVQSIVAKPREAIAILRFGLPRKARAVKAKVGRPRKSNPTPVVATPNKA